MSPVGKESAQAGLKKQYLSSGSAPKKTPIEPRPSASILLISPTNEILLLHRVRRKTDAFAAAHVFPGGNLSASQDGAIPSVQDPERHVDGDAYRMGAIRECFEESGILLAKRKQGENNDELVEISEDEREKARKAIHGGKVKFGDWVQENGGVVDSDGLIPFTRWITPTNVPKRFTTQMYIYFLPLQQKPLPGLPLKAATQIPVPTSDGGIEHTAAVFGSCAHWLDLARRNEIILFPPQFYLMHLLAPFLVPLSSPSAEELQRQRDAVLEFLERDDGSGVSWRDKVMSPTAIGGKSRDGRAILALDKPGPELKDSKRAGDRERVVLVKFGKQGPRDVEVRSREEVLKDAREGESKL